ncbi:MAG: hypothetical protein JSV27_07675 [Candidatus Bathyarchaeota archaeon]|nr:MAG: hypothetical protein JSV27_07675 [Candidatus Bathyarchaeota archaeon]
MHQFATPTENVNDVREVFESTVVFDRDMTYEGDLIIDGNASVIVEDCDFEIDGRVLLSGDSTLILRNARIRLVESREGRSEDAGFMFTMNESSRFDVVNTTVETISFRSFSIHVSDGVEALFDNVYSLEWHGLTCEGDSKVQIVDSSCWSMIETRDESTLSVRDSRIYGVNTTGGSSAFLEGVYTTKASVEAASSLEAINSTISSETEGLELVFQGDTELVLCNFSTVSSGIGYELCDHWSLVEDNVASKVHIDVSLDHVYLRLIQFVVEEGSDVSLEGLHAPHAKIVCSAEDIEAVDSTLKQVELLQDCALNACHVEFDSLTASGSSFASLADSKLGQVSGRDESMASISSSEIRDVDGRGSAVMHLNNCSVLDSISVSDSSVIFQNDQPISMDGFDYDLKGHKLNVRFENPLDERIQVDMILDRNRIREMRDLKVSLDGDPLVVDSEMVKDLRIASFSVPSGTGRLSVSLGPVPPERVPFFLTLVGQQVISLAIILVLVIAVLLAWK